MSNRKLFYDSVIQLPEQGITPHGMMVNAAEPQHGDDDMTVQFALSIPDDAQAELEKRVESGEVISFDELNKKYAPQKKDTDKLVAWLKEQGYKHVAISS